MKTTGRNHPENLQLLFDTMKSGFALHEIITDSNGTPVDYRFIDTNKAFEDLTGLSRSEIIGKTVHEVIPLIEEEWIRKYGEVALEGKSINFEQYSAGLGKFYDVVAYCPKQGFFAVVFNDITQFRKTTEALRVERDFIKHVMGIIPIGVAVMNSEGKITFCNQRAEEILEVKSDIASNMYYNSIEWMHCDMDGKPIDSEELPFYKARALKHTVMNVRFGIYNNEGRRKFLSVNATPILDNEENVTEVITAFEDITVQSDNEHTIKESLAEKETLLKEIHHRVKNNFQVISSLINLQLSKSNVNENESILHETKTRIRAMALVHEKLYQTKSLSSIDLSEYTKTLTRDIELNLRALPRKPRIEYTLTPVLLDLERAVPCGLIINEIITNAFKYAFPPDFDGNPLIRIEIIHNDTTILRISDNGIGMSSPVDFSSSKTLGISLIGMLSKQIRAGLEVTTAGGVSYTINLS